MNNSCCCCLDFVSRKNENLNSLSINDLCKVAKTGDIILFSGISSASKFVEIACASMWSHVGIIYENPQKQNDPLLFESVHAKDHTYDVQYSIKKHASGVRLVNLRDYIQGYKGNCIALRQLQCSSSESYIKLHKHLCNVLHNVIISIHGRPYENRWLEFFLARFRCLGSYGETEDSFFCSELVSYCYKQAGLIAKPYFNHNNEMLPDDYSEMGSKLNLIMPKGIFGKVELSKERYIEFGKSKKGISTQKYTHANNTNPSYILSNPYDQYITNNNSDNNGNNEFHYNFSL